jgi:hypothetical protein
VQEAQQRGEEAPLALDDKNVKKKGRLEQERDDRLATRIMGLYPRGKDLENVGGGYGGFRYC